MHQELRELSWGEVYDKWQESNKLNFDKDKTTRTLINHSKTGHIEKEA